jgi:hypothetical protein
VWRVRFDPGRHCERSEAIHIAAKEEWIASSLSLLAMTANTASRSRRMFLREACQERLAF